MRALPVIRRVLLAVVLLAGWSAALAQTNLIINGGFEQGTNGWTILGIGASVSSNGRANSGSAYLALGATYNNQDANQTVTLPTNTVVATLSYYYSVYSVDKNATGDSFLYVYVRDSLGNVLQVLDSKSNLDQDQTQGTYHQAVFDLSAYAGKTIQIDFYYQAPAQGVLFTYFGIDDVSLTAVRTSDLPSNDDFTNRTALAGNSVTVMATNTYATKEPGEPDHARNPGGKSLWWSWTATVPGIVTISTDGSSFNTLLAAYTGAVLTNLTVVADNNSDNGRGIFGSTVNFKAAPGVQYQIAVDGFNGASGTIYLSLNFAPDTKPPTVSISYPAAGGKLTNSTVTVLGTASDDIAVAQVDYRLENAAGTNEYQAAIGTNHWSATITNLIPGLNTVRVRGIDTSSNVSVGVARTFSYVVVSPFTLTTNGSGTVSPNLNGQLLAIGQPYTITAKPAAGFVFSNWTGGLSATTPVLKFIMQTNLSLQANFIPNPFIPVTGSYAGLFLNTNGPANTNSGFFTAALTSKGTFSAKVQLAGKTYSVSGSLSLVGAYSNSIARSGLTPLSIQLQADLIGGEILSGTLSADSWTSQLTAHRGVYSKSNPAPQGLQKYTVVIPNGDDASSQPAGYGFGALTIDASGNINFSGTLGDGTKVTQRTFVSSDGLWPFYFSLYRGGGSLFGWLGFTNGTGVDIQGIVNWSKPTQTGTKIYPNGFNFANGLEVIGSLFEFTNGVPVVDLGSNGVVVLQGGNLAQSITNGFALSAANTTTTTNKSSLRITTSSGLFQGSIINPATGRAVSVNGALLQKQNVGFGTFAGTNETGSLYYGH